MADEVKEAIEVLRNLPDDRQHTVARAILDYAADYEVYRLSDYERREVRTGLAEIKRGEIATDEEVDAFYKSVGL